MQQVTVVTAVLETWKLALAMPLAAMAVAFRSQLARRHQAVQAGHCLLAVAALIDEKVVM